MSAENGASSLEVVAEFLAPPELRALEFRRDDVAPEEHQRDLAPELSFSLSITRYSMTDLGVTFGLELKGLPGVQIRAAYRVVVRVPNGPPDEIDRQLRVIASRVAPIALFPYLRETISSTLMRSGILAAPPPVLDFSSIDGSTLGIPPPPEPSDAASPASEGSDTPK